MIVSSTLEYVLGVDPGADGALARLNRFDRTLKVHGFKELTEEQISELFAVYSLDRGHLYLEDVHAFPHQGVVSMFNFGDNCGFLRGCITAHGIPFQKVTPQRWQKALCLGKTYPTPRARKKAHLQVAQQLFPGRRDITLPLADAVLIAEYGYRLQQLPST